MRVELSEAEKILSQCPDEQAALDLRAVIVAMARKELREQQFRAKFDAIAERPAPPAPVQPMPQRKGGKRYTRLQAAAYVGHCPTDFSHMVQMDMVRPDNPDVPNGSKYEFCQAALTNFLDTYSKTERTRRLSEFKQSRKAEKARRLKVRQEKLFPQIGNI